MIRKQVETASERRLPLRSNTSHVAAKHMKYIIAPINSLIYLIWVGLLRVVDRKPTLLSIEFIFTILQFMFELHII